MARVLIADDLPETAASILQDAGIDVDTRAGRSEKDIARDIAAYDGLIVRSSTIVTRRIIEAGAALKVIGRAGVGVDNIDCDAATQRGVVVMNTPQANIVSAAEHTVALLLALARNIPAAAVETGQGVWDRKKHTGVELENKVLGVAGLGRIGQHVARVCNALGMRVIAFDPYISGERAKRLNVELVDWDALLANADFLTLHVPKTEATLGMIDAEALAKMKSTARLVNVARGGVVDEAALAQALHDGVIAGAAVDVYSTEPVSADNPLLAAPNVILTPHLGASTLEAQDKVAEGIARQFVDFFTSGIMQNAVNLEVFLDPELQCYGVLAGILGSLAAQLLTSGRLRRVRVSSEGAIAKADTGALAVSALSGVLAGTASVTVNLVNAAHVAQDRGIELIETRFHVAKNYVNLLSVEVSSNDCTRTVSGTCFNERDPRIVAIDGMEIDLKPAPNILIMKYEDRPGMVGKFGTILGNACINIAGMEVGRTRKGAEAIVALTLDDPVTAEVEDRLREIIEPNELHVVGLRLA